MTDNSNEEIRDFDEVRYSNDKVRHYSADGLLYAYRDGDEHVVVSRGREPSTRWTKRVPAERDAVATDDHLWTIPDNWEYRVTIDGAGTACYEVYHIPETHDDVLVTVPNKCHLVDAWYGVKRVGTLSVTYDDEIHWDELEASIEVYHDEDGVSKNVLEALETLYRCRHSFEKKFIEEVDFYAEEALLDGVSEPFVVEDWTASPWQDLFQVSYFLDDCLDQDLDRETKSEVEEKLREVNVIPPWPTVRVDVEEDEVVHDE